MDVVIQCPDSKTPTLRYEEVRAANPAAVLLNVSALGERGTLGDAKVAGPHIAALSGLMGSLIQSSQGKLRQALTTYGDTQAALAGTAGVLAALHRARRTGTGAHIDLSQWEAAMSGLDLLFLEAQAGLTNPERHHAWKAPHGIFPASGADAWLAISCQSDAQWQALCQALELDELLADESLASAPGRLAAAPRIEDRLAAATRTFDKHALSRRLQALGVPAAPVEPGRQGMAAGHLEARGLTEGGVLRQLPWRSRRGNRLSRGGGT
jgi:crotonobetainyl-CoA:carnitine CoA-transferase CaiB-like acyl-CoA transferase